MKHIKNMVSLDNVLLFMGSDPRFQKIRSFPATVYAKYTDGTYVGANDSLIEMAGLTSVTDIKNKTDEELCWSASSEALRQNDLSVLENERAICQIENVVDCNENKIDMLSFKLPFYSNDEKVVGLLGISINSEKQPTSDLFDMLTQTMRTFESDYPALSANSLMQRKQAAMKSRQEILNRLTQRERDCVKCLCQGLSAKETAKVLGLSYRTVEVYYEKIKVKLGVRRKIEILSLLYGSDEDQ